MAAQQLSIPVLFAHTGQNYHLDIRLLPNYKLNIKYEIFRLTNVPEKQQIILIKLNDSYISPKSSFNYVEYFNQLSDIDDNRIYLYDKTNPVMDIIDGDNIEKAKNVAFDNYLYHYRVFENNLKTESLDESSSWKHKLDGYGELLNSLDEIEIDGLLSQYIEFSQNKLVRSLNELLPSSKIKKWFNYCELSYKNLQEKWEKLVRRANENSSSNDANDQISTIHDYMKVIQELQTNLFEQKSNLKLWIEARTKFVEDMNYLELVEKFVVGFPELEQTFHKQIYHMWNNESKLKALDTTRIGVALGCDLRVTDWAAITSFCNHVTKVDDLKATNDDDDQTTTFKDNPTPTSPFLNNDKISHSSFKVGDVALFMPTGRSSIYLAFHTGAPHRYLSMESLENCRGNKKNPDYVLGRIVFLDEKEGSTGDEYFVPSGVKYFVLTVEIVKVA